MGTTELISLQLRMFLVMLLGLLFRKKNIITAEGKKNLTDLVIYLILPCNIVKSFMIEFDGQVLQNFGLVLLISIGIQVVCTTLAKVLYRKVKPGRKAVLQYATIVSNAGFLGNPVAEGVFGSMGLAMASIYLIPQRIVMWSAGVSYFTAAADDAGLGGEKTAECGGELENDVMAEGIAARKVGRASEVTMQQKRNRRREVFKRVITHPCIIAVFVGIVFMLLQVKLPPFLDSALKDLSNCNTAMSMLVIGTILADVRLKDMLDKSVFAFSGLRLVVIPLLTFAGCLLCGLGGIVTGVSVLLAAMPAASTTAILAAKYEGDAIYASKCVVTTTVLSLLTTPIWSMVLLRL